jgi:hypothetical protein
MVQYWELGASTLRGGTRAGGKNTGHGEAQSPGALSGVDLLPRDLQSRMDLWAKNGIHSVATFVPWQAFESDLTHSLSRFLSAAIDRGISVRLLPMPEPGMSYPLSGLPKEWVTAREVRAEDREGRAFGQNLPPSAYAYPSPHAPEFQKKLSAFLGRLDQFLAEFVRNQPRAVESVSIDLSGSFWKYLRSPRASARAPFAETAVDQSAFAVRAYRERLERWVRTSEIVSEKESRRWESREAEPLMREFFEEKAEKEFRSRMLRSFKPRALGVPVREIELHTPEADPALSFSALLQWFSGGKADQSRLNRLIDEAVCRVAATSTGRPLAPALRWSSLGGFASLAVAERQKLFMKSLLLVGAQEGALLVDEEEWFAFSPGFRARAQRLARAIEKRELSSPARALYWYPRLWADAGDLWNQLHSQAGGGVRMLANSELLACEVNAQLLVVDPCTILSEEDVLRALAWARSGRVLALPESSFFTETAKRALERELRLSASMDLRLGIPYRIFECGLGKVIRYRSPMEVAPSEVAPRGWVPSELKWMRGEFQAAWRGFAEVLLRMSEVAPYVTFSDRRVELLALEHQVQGSGIALFLVNQGAASVTGDLIFPTQVAVSDLTSLLREKESEAGQSPPVNRPLPLPSERFSLEVPPDGVLPLAVSGISYRDVEERRAAARLGVETRESVLRAAETELPGFEREHAIETLWNL